MTISKQLQVSLGFGAFAGLAAGGLSVATGLVSPLPALVVGATFGATYGVSFRFKDVPQKIKLAVSAAFTWAATYSTFYAMGSLSALKASIIVTGFSVTSAFLATYALASVFVAVQKLKKQPALLPTAATI